VREPFRFAHHGYGEILMGLSKPKSRRYKELREMFPYLEPNEFSIDAVNRDLRALAATWKPTAKKPAARRTKAAND